YSVFDTSTADIYTLSLHDALPILRALRAWPAPANHDRSAAEGASTYTYAQAPGRPRAAGRLPLLRHDSDVLPARRREWLRRRGEDRKSTRLNSSHQIISYAVFRLQ